VKNRKLTSNPFAGTAPKAPRRARGDDARAPYDDAEAKAILTATRKEAGWLRWGPWLLAFTGARISEMSEMKRGNVREEGGVPILDIRPNAQRAGKNDTFQRMMPLHPALIAEGFLDYVASLPADPKGPLFPQVTADKKGERSVNAQASMSRWIKGTMKITDATKAPAHSWRHKMEDDLRKVRAPAEVQDAITGRHNPRNSGAGYGKGYRGMPAEGLVELSRVPSPVS
jgi:integrase